jgi:hypothetical protein
VPSRSATMRPAMSGSWKRAGYFSASAGFRRPWRTCARGKASRPRRKPTAV